MPEFLCGVWRDGGTVFPPQSNVREWQTNVREWQTNVREWQTNVRERQTNVREWQSNVRERQTNVRERQTNVRERRKNVRLSRRNVPEWRKNIPILSGKGTFGQKMPLPCCISGPAPCGQAPKSRPGLKALYLHVPEQIGRASC